jgi:hypothetical protein
MTASVMGGGAAAIPLKKGVDIWGPNVTVDDLFEGEVKGRLLLDKLFDLYQALHFQRYWITTADQTCKVGDHGESWCFVFFSDVPVSVSLCDDLPIRQHQFSFSTFFGDSGS